MAGTREGAAMTDPYSTQISAPVEVLGHRIQQALQVILAGLDERDALSGPDMEALRRELRMLLQSGAHPDRDRGDRQGRAGPGLHAAPEYRRVPEPVVRQVRADRPGDLEPVRRGRGSGIQGTLRPLGPGCRAPAPAGGAGDHARPVPPQHVPRHAPDVCLRRALPGAWSSAGCASA